MAIMQFFATRSSDTEADQTCRTQDTDSARTAIVEAARQLANREGAEAVTLDAAAAEAGFAPATVYAHFLSKEDLQVAVVASDLQILAGIMRQSQDELGAEVTEAGVAEAAPEDAAEQSEDGNDGDSDEVGVETDEADTFSHVTEVSSEAVPGITADVEAADNSAETAETAAEDQPQEAAESLPDRVGEERRIADRRASDAPPRRLGRSYLRRLIGDPATDDDKPDLRRQTDTVTPELRQQSAGTSDVSAAITRLEDRLIRVESRPVNSWLERRLRVFERTLSDLHTRVEKIERDTASSLSTLAEGHKAVEQRVNEALDNSGREAEDSEQRHRAVVADTRMYVRDLSGRLSAIENSVSRLLSDNAGPSAENNKVDTGFAEAFGASEPLLSGDAHAEEALHDQAPDQQDETTDNGEAPSTEHSEQTEPEDYLVAARRAANLSAAKQRTEPGHRPLQALRMAPANAKGLSVSRRTLQMIAAALILVVGALAVTIASGNKAAAVVPPRNVIKTVAAGHGDAQVVALAKAGNIKAALVVGLQRLTGDGSASDLPAAAHWLTRAATHGQPLAQYWLGTLYERGRGVARDRSAAMGWYEKAANAGNVKAMYRLGVGYAEGWNGTTNYVKAAQWFTRAANLGLIDAQFNLAVLYERGAGVPQSFANALKWYDIAAARGDAVSKARAAALATQVDGSNAAAARSEAAKFDAKSPDPAANEVPTVAGTTTASLTLP